MKQNPAEREHGTSITLRNGLVKNVSQNFTSLTGYMPEMVTGKTIEELLVKDLKATLEKPELINKSENLHCFIFNKWMIPEEVYISFTECGASDETIVSIHTADSLGNGRQSLREKYESLLEKEQAEKEELKKALKAKDDYVLFIAHELKTPLAIINSAVQAIEYLCGNELSDKCKGYLKRIKQYSHKQLRLINNILDISRLNAGCLKIDRRNMDVVGLAREITESVKLYAQQKNISLKFSSALDSMIIALDEDMFERMLLNLLSNAIKFTPAGGEVNVSVSKTCSGSRDYARIMVRDQGIGIPEDKQQLVFECFGQADYTLARQTGGTGLGLSLVKKIASALGGDVFLESKIGEGSTFIIQLPVMHVQEYRVCENSPGQNLSQAVAIEFSDYLS
ncbi:MAG TPA: HAMP domain-containing sensor histidine kinase [Thermoclostridium sp.]|nr:HAMP domain-containing histidine kinase [Clostridiaceae bacterium]HOQ75858.1 HAMP domain-containing sensor histidine kinase [Thermoclostridium sp.]